MCRMRVPFGAGRGRLLRVASMRAFNRCGVTVVATCRGLEVLVRIPRKRRLRRGETCSEVHTFEIWLVGAMRCGQDR